MRIIKIFLWSVCTSCAGVVILWCILLVFGWRIGAVQSSSMAPKINVGDLICWVSVREISSGDIVVFEQNGKRVAHRVLRVEGDNVAVRGDSALSKIELISASQICGKCVVSFSVGNLFIVILIVSVLFGFSGAFFFHKIKKG